MRRTIAIAKSLRRPHAPQVTCRIIPQGPKSSKQEQNDDRWQTTIPLVDSGRLPWASLFYTTVRLRPSRTRNAVLRIGTKEAAPFAVLNEDGTWSGISIELWRGVANEIGLRYEFVDLPLDEILASVESGDLDAGVAAITITHDREQHIDFSHSYFNSGLGIAVAVRQSTSWSAVIRRLFSTVFLEIVIAILGVLLVMGTLVYLFERRRNREDFGGGVIKGLSNGIWWAAVTMTTVGYGDKVPKTPGGRAIAVVWMYTAIVIISIFTASVTSILTLSQLESNVRRPARLAQCPSSDS